MQLKQRLLDYSARSNLHGVNHIKQAQNNCAKFTWVLATIFSFSFCCGHVYYTVLNFLETPISSSYFLDSTEAEFPDLTFCNLQASSAYAFARHKDILFQHLKNKWNYFENYLDIYHELKQNHSIDKSQTTTKDWNYELFKIYLTILWASDDLRDFAMSDTNLIRYCVYNSKFCTELNFTLIQNHQFWNCYRFEPNVRKISSNQLDKNGLELIMYTDSITFSDIPKSRMLKYSKKKARKHLKKYNMNSIRDFFEDGHDLRNIQKDSYLTSGLQIFIHKKNTYPFSSTLSYPISNGALTNIYLRQTNYELVNQVSNPCSHSHDTTEYVTYFGVNSTNVGIRPFELRDKETVLNRKQNLMFKKCGCYSHKYPFNYGTKRLCYFVPSEYSINPTKEIISKILCHDTNYKIIEHDFSFASQASVKAQRPCEDIRYSAQIKENKWPKENDLKSFVNLLIEFSNESQKAAHNHHLIRNVSFATKSNILSVLLNKSCSSGDLHGNDGIDFQSYEWCTNSELIRGNHVAIQISPRYTTANEYKEFATYQWPEVLSEIGGTIGLWLGISLLTVAELIEITIICLTHNMNKSKEANNIKCTCHKHLIPPREVIFDTQFGLVQIADHKINI